MTLNPQIQSLLAAFAEMPPVDFATVSAEMMRAINDRPMQFGPPPEVAQVEDMELSLPGRTISARLYRPDAPSSSPAPLLLYFHGGGWVVGTLDTHDATCRGIARSSGVPVLSVDYRLAPEHPFPAPLDDCYDALLWVKDNAGRLGIDPARLAVGGDSAGGNLAAAVAIRARDEGGPELRHQLLIYPVTDGDFDRPSYAENGDGSYFLSLDAMRWFWRQYLGFVPSGHVALATVLRSFDLSGLPGATVLTAEYDPLRDEGIAYADRLKEAGVAVTAATAPGMIHGFVSMAAAVPDAQPWIEWLGKPLREALD